MSATTCLRCGDPYHITSKYFGNYCQPCHCAFIEGEWSNRNV